MKNLIIITSILLSVVSYTNAQDLIITSGGNHSLDPPDNPKFKDNFAYLWWFSDGGYSITTTDQTNYRYQYLNPNMRASFSNEYVTTLVRTENYGTEGNPDLIHLPNPCSSLPQTGQDIQKYLVASDPTDFVRVTSFRNAVHGDTLYIPLTYGLPNAMDTLQFTGMSLNVTFTEDMDQFEYLDFGDVNESFLPHFEDYIPSTGNGFNWSLPQIASPGLHAGEERTILLPFRYNGYKNEGSLKIKVKFKYDYSNFSGTVSGTATQLGEAPLKFAKSHDPNSTQVSVDTVSCVCGGKELEYEVQFENTGKKETDYVRIEMQMDNAHDLSSLEVTSLPREFLNISDSSILGYQYNYPGREAFYKIDQLNNKIVFEFHRLILMGSSDILINDPSRAKDYIKFKVRVKDDYVIGNPITASALIFFDTNKEVPTNEVETTCPNPITDDVGNNDLRPEPKPRPSPCDNHWCNCLFWIITSIILFIIILVLVWYIWKKRSE